MQRTLLVVDDEPQIGRLIARMIGRSFDAVHLATSRTEAEAVLVSHAVTHVACDFFLGAGTPLGHDLLAAWRKRWPAIRYAALFTGSPLEERASPEGINGIFVKPGGISDLVSSLNGCP